MTATRHRRTYAALQHVIDALESDSWSDAIHERGFRLTVSDEGGALIISPDSTVPGPSAPPVRCRYPEDQRLQRARNHLTWLRGDLLSIGLDFADRFPDVFRKITSGEAVQVVEYEPRRSVGDAVLRPEDGRVQGVTVAATGFDE
ncbi:hypothetical protein ABZ135_23550 [Streptomyces sp. NPDC006339]|uniref:hypothetical protein n=1 Tax=Streptomyces sp. NPDC006339 TaxID=3156755 RepID=UPI0033AC0F87